MSSCQGSSQPIHRICVSCTLELAGGFFTTEPQGKPLYNSVVKNLLANAGDAGDAGSIPAVRKIPW